MPAPPPADIDAYIAGFPGEVQRLLQQLRAAAKEAAPQAAEAIKYSIPTLVMNGNLVSFAAFQKHIGLYPVPAGDEDFEAAIAPYRSGKSTLQFPLDKPLPLALIKKLVQLRVRQFAAKAAKKKSSK